MSSPLSKPSVAPAALRNARRCSRAGARRLVMPAVNEAVLPVATRQRRRSAGTRSSRSSRAAAQLLAPGRPRHRRGRCWAVVRRVRVVAVHRVAGRPDPAVGRARRRRDAVFPQHGSRALHARHRRDRGDGIQPVLEALGARLRRARATSRISGRDGRSAPRRSRAICSAATRRPSPSSACSSLASR